MVRSKDENYHFHGKHLSEYDRTKAAAHNLAKDFMAKGLPLVIVMPGLHLWTWRHIHPVQQHYQFLEGTTLPSPTRPEIAGRMWKTLSRPAFLAMEKGKIGETYIIAGERYTFTEAFKLASEITGKPAPKTIRTRCFV